MKTRIQEVDRIVGRNIREFRLLGGHTQHSTGEWLGVSFQQIQKYESGMNRVAAGRIAALAELFGVEIIDLFKETNLNTTLSQENKTIMALVRSVVKIKDKGVKKRLCSLVKTIAEEYDDK